MGARVNRGEPKAGFRWNAQKHRAAILLAENELTDRQIAETLGIGRTSLHYWKQNPEFAAQVGDHIGEIQAGMLRLAIAKKHKRLKVLDELHEKLLTVIEERAGEHPGVAGDGTGLIVEQVKQLGTGANAQVIEEYVVDTATVREIRALHEQAAKELGQWQDRLQVEGLTTTIEIVGVADDAI